MAERHVMQSPVAILAIDAVGYSRQMGRDEEATLDQLKLYRELIEALVSNHGGRVFGVAGDSEMAVLPEAQEALICALEIQDAVAEQNKTLPKERQMPLRIGINFGRALIESEGVYGDDVNIAARVEALAGTGGICLSGAVFERLGDKLPCGYEAYGPQRLKNIAVPIRVFRVRTEPGMVGRVVPSRLPRPRRYWRATAAAALIAVGVAGLWNLYLQDELDKWQATAAVRQAAATAERERAEQLFTSLLAAEGRIESELARGAELLAALQSAKLRAAARQDAAAEAARRAGERQAEETARTQALLDLLKAAESRAAGERERAEELLASLQAMEQRAMAAEGDRLAEHAAARRQAEALLASWQVAERQAGAERGRAAELVAALEQAAQRASADAAAQAARQAELARDAAAERARAEQLLAALRAAEQRASDELKSGAALMAALGRSGNADKRARVETLLHRLRSVDQTVGAERVRAERLLATWGHEDVGDAPAAAEAEPPGADRERAEALVARWQETERLAAAKRADAEALLTRLRRSEAQAPVEANVPPRPARKPAALRSSKPATQQLDGAPSTPSQSTAPLGAAGRLAAVGEIDGAIAAAALAGALSEPPTVRPGGPAPDAAAVYPSRGGSVDGRIPQGGSERQTLLSEPESVAAIERQLRDRKAALRERLQAYIDQNPGVFDGGRPRIIDIWDIIVVSRQIDDYRVRVTFGMAGTNKNSNNYYTPTWYNSNWGYDWILTLRLENDDIQIVGHALNGESVGGRIRQRAGERQAMLAEPESTAAVERQLWDRKAALRDRLQAYIDQNPGLLKGQPLRVTTIWDITVVSRQTDGYRVRVTFDERGDLAEARHGFTTREWTLTLKFENDDIQIVDHTPA